MPGPLPETNKRRRNAPTIPTTSLPASGFDGEIPDPPKSYDLSSSGAAWWAWAWRTPQAAAWSAGDLYVLARRASVEDDIKSIDLVDLTICLDGLGEAEESELRAIFARVKALVTGRLSLLKEARDLDDRLGLTPKGLAALRWKIVADKEPKANPTGDREKGKTYGHLKTVG
jgi:hypothetical protein